LKREIPSLHHDSSPNHPKEIHADVQENGGIASHILNLSIRWR